MPTTEIAIEDIWLMREGGENNPLAHVTVCVKMKGIWYVAIRELAESNFSHCITASGLTSLPLAKWGNEGSPPQEQP